MSMFKLLPGSGLLAAFAALAAAATFLSACGSSGVVSPSRSATLSGLPSRSAAALPSAAPSQTADSTTGDGPSRSEPQTETQTKTQTRTQTAIQTETAISTQTATVAQPSAAAKPSAAAQPPAGAAAETTSSSTPSWVWWLLGAAALAAAVIGALAVRRSGRKREWTEKFTAAKGEAGWFSRELIPQLGQAPTAQQIAGGWRMAADRVVALEDGLSTLEATARDDLSRSKARTMRDAVRTSRTRLAALDTTGDTASAQNLLFTAAADVEAALASVDPAASPAAGNVAPR